MKRLGNQICEIVQSSDYIKAYCSKCGGDDLEVDLGGMHGHVPQLQFTCGNCGDLGVWKLNRAGLGFLQKTSKVHRHDVDA
jgi:hypothetical protein